MRGTLAHGCLVQELCISINQSSNGEILDNQKSLLQCVGIKTENNVVRRVWRYQRLNQNPKIEVHTTQWPKEKGQSTVYKTIHIKLNIEQHGPHQKPGVNSGAPEGWSVPAPLMAPAYYSVSVPSFYWIPKFHKS